MFVIETDKITLEVEAPASGVLSWILTPAGTTVPVLEVVGPIVVAGEVLQQPSPPAREIAGQETASEAIPETIASRPMSDTGIRSTPR